MSFFDNLKSNNHTFQILIGSAKMVAKTNATVLIEGETGVGKEVLANALQKESKRKSKPFIILNCATLPENLVESVLFGHLKGAFTGATKDKKGIFQVADGGTVFLDEINSLPLAIQGKLLRFLESGEYCPVGSTRVNIVDVRIITATNKDLKQLIRGGYFREDLFFRLNIFPLKMPPLRERKDDIEFLAKYFIEHFSIKYKLASAKFSDKSINRFYCYTWPGNVRELRNICERMTILYPDKVIMPVNLPNELQDIGSIDVGSRFMLPEKNFNLDIHEADLIFQSLQKNEGNRSKSARMLGISRDTLVYRMEKHGLTWVRPKSQAIDKEKISDSVVIEEL
jgi:transcriptional regulator with PAS, ATPase and Fis domain